jgi:hypothetical protein
MNQNTGNELLTFYLDPDQHSPEGLEQDPYGIYLKG